MNFTNRSSKGKKIKKKNGSDTIVIYSINGAIQVKNQRYVLEGGSASSYLSQCGQLVNGQYSAKLADFIEEWSDDLGYEKLSKLLTQITGNEILSASGIQSGARTIRLSLEKIFGSSVCIILDWYHLQLKIKTLHDNDCLQ